MREPAIVLVNTMSDVSLFYPSSIPIIKASNKGTKCDGEGDNCDAERDNPIVTSNDISCCIAKESVQWRSAQTWHAPLASAKE